jgi:molecular chaperone GrpE
MQEASETSPDNTVIREFQKGYLIQERLLRPSMVVVSKGDGVSEKGDPE